jgi:ribosome-associated translation inhibitor RaiA
MVKNMQFCIAARHVEVTTHLWSLITKQVEKFDQRLPNLHPGLGLIKLVIKRNRRRNYFDGSVAFSLPKKHLYVRFLGTYLEEEVNKAFDQLFKELGRYKGKHFANDSQYFRHESIRRSYEFR